MSAKGDDETHDEGAYPEVAAWKSLMGLHENATAVISEVAPYIGEGATGGMVRTFGDEGTLLLLELLEGLASALAVASGQTRTKLRKQLIRTLIAIDHD